MIQQTTPSSVLPTPSAQPTTTLTTFDGDFGSGDRSELVIKPTLMTNPRLQWMTGKLTTTDFETPVGWHVEADVNPQLDELLTAMGTKRYTVQHISGGANSETKLVPYWALNHGGKSCSLFVIAYGVKSAREMNRDPEGRYGVAYGWEVVKDRQGNSVYKKNSTEPKRQCRVQFRAFVHELVAQGFHEWFQVSMSGYLTDDILTAFYDQYRVLDAFDARMRAKGSPINAPFWGFSIPMVPGPARLVGPKDGAQTTIIPMATQVPKRIDEISVAYLNQHRIPHELQEGITSGLLTATWEWSIKRSVELNGGSGEATQGDEKVEAQSTTVVTEEPVAPPQATVVDAVPPAPTLPPALPDDPFISEAQASWLRTQCGNNASVIQAWCERFAVPDLPHLRSSQFIALYNLMIQDRQQAQHHQ